MGTDHYIRFFSEIGMADVPLVGGKNASLGELYQALRPQGVNVPNGFAVTADAYRAVLDQAGAWAPLRQALDGLDTSNVKDLARCGAEARRIVRAAPLPEDLCEEIRAAYRTLREEYGDTLSLAVRSSATAEDLPTASFAGQQDTYLNVRGEDALLAACRDGFASLFTDRAIHYRVAQGFDHFDVALSLGVMKMVRSDQAVSGVLFTLDTESGFRDVVFINAAYGLGENVVQGAVDPDEYTVFKPTFEAGHRTILRRRLGAKKIKMIYADEGGDTTTRNVDTTEQERARYCLSEAEVMTLTDYALRVERHYSEQAGADRPMDIEWAKDALDGQLYLVQARPETVVSQRSASMMEEYRLKDRRSRVLATGRAVGERIGTGRVRQVDSAKDLSQFQPGEVLVTGMTAPDWEPVMKTAAAVVTDRGGRTCHAAIVARELGIPAVVGTGDGTERLKDGQTVTVSCAEGDTGRIYEGELAFEVERTALDRSERPQTHIMLTLGNPELAFRFSFLPNDGVGLARMEHIINEYIRIHPMALVHPDRVTDPEARRRIEAETRGYDHPTDFFVERLSEGVGTIAAAFYPKPVIVRLSDFKSNEYASLLGGAAFEPEEENPMLGFRGAARYTHPAYAAGFALECRAFKRVREAMGLDNVRVMVPFCRRVAEAERVLAAMAEHGLKRSEHGLEVYVMCEIPNNVISIDRFARCFDGFSIGSNDLAQLTLGVDRDSALVAGEFDERDEGVLEMLRLAVSGARRNGRHVGICGQAPSDYPEVAEFLVRQQIDSISLNPDSVLRTTLHILAVEKRLGRVARAGAAMKHRDE